MDGDTSQRKIELQSPEDLTYLINNVRTAAAEKLNEAFPIVEGAEGEDELRNHIESLVTEYINKTFILASDNLAINGLPVPPSSFLPSSDNRASSASRPSLHPEPNYEPFDTKKRQVVADLITREEKLLEEVASLKRSVPGAAAKEQADRLKAAIQTDQEMLDEAVERVRARDGVAEGSEELVAVAVGRLERQDGMEDGFRRAVEGLSRLKKDMPSVVARMQRAKDAGEYVMMAGQ